MKYPIRIPGYVATDGYPLELFPPSSVVVAAANYLKPVSTVLDMGAYVGTNGFYLADLGHLVDSVEINQEYIRDGQIIARHLGGLAARNYFINEDIRSYNVGSYDAAIATNVLQSLSRPEAIRILDNLSTSVRGEGLNIIRAYLGTAEQQAEVPGITLLEPGELEERYRKAGWTLLHYTEDLQPLRQGVNPHSGKPEIKVDSAVEAIAKSQGRSQSVKDRTLQYADYLHRSDPELAEHYEAQAAVNPSSDD